MYEIAQTAAVMWALSSENAAVCPVRFGVQFAKAYLAAIHMLEPGTDAKTKAAALAELSEEVFQVTEGADAESAQ